MTLLGTAGKKMQLVIAVYCIAAVSHAQSRAVEYTELGVPILTVDGGPRIAHPPGAVIHDVIVATQSDVRRPSIHPDSSKVEATESPIRDRSFASLGRMTVGASVSLQELARLATAAVPFAATQRGREEQYVVVQGTVVSSRVVRRPELVPPVRPYAEYKVAVESVTGIGASIEPTSELDVIALWPPRLESGELIVVIRGGGGDLGIPLSDGVRFIGVGIRNDGRGNGAAAAYRPEYWPKFHITFVVIANDDDSWSVVMSGHVRQYELDLARTIGDDGLVPVAAWFGEARAIEASTAEVFECLVQVAKEAAAR